VPVGVQDRVDVVRGPCPPAGLQAPNQVLAVITLEKQATLHPLPLPSANVPRSAEGDAAGVDRKSTRLNSSHNVERLLAAAKTGADVITFRQQAIYNGLESEVHFGINNQDGPFTPGGITLRAPWHVCAWKRERVQGCLFLEANYSEDIAWCKQARRRIRTAHHIDAVLHSYRHDAATTAAPEL